MDNVVGKCGNCGGNVTLPRAWYGIDPPEPTCKSCGAVAKSHLPVVEMEPARARQPFRPLSTPAEPEGGETNG